MSWERLIRFQDESGQQRFGEPVIKDADELETLLAKGELFANEFKGSGPFDLEATGQRMKVVKLLGILESADVPIVKCVGLNYMKHIQEAGRKPPPYPSIFIKSRTSIASHDEDIPIPKLAQDEQCDYEGELSIVIGKTGKNIAKADVLSHIAGYVASNDVSARKWQRDPAYAGGVPQFCFSKGFDKYAPVGPMIVSPKVVGNGSGLRLQTFVNGESRQDTRTDDLIFDVEEIVAFISQGSTLEKGTVIMTGTPSGVAMGMSPPAYLKHGDVVEVKIEHLGSVKNKMVFE
ncbi:5-carboxymethyl-2-hydroxymuconate isomerase [Exophiala aquamarina CBS 119918]|uniref:5-carboxymethyl-2-hydroxymuconate isomerase n=1 Tax=Exophiala aquamarina CBS 119918 TaxID=1182545 RepID=A0A072P863_9EURO|nr:5-carboxymethyl-2-hydroxymuconate isomerase [Exophiala aquamarina CBS 119918]KEF55483.1 5-carboxymethyl-2-hydroxymuconate isomerase [Exophiala aquamarina CBS 119918]